MNIQPMQIVKAVSLTAFLFSVAAINLGNDCNGTPSSTDSVALELNFQICSDVSTFSARGLTIRWEGTLRSGASGATTGETSFSLPYSVQLPTADSPSGRSWFQSSVGNLRAGEWNIEVEYIFGAGADIRDRVELLADGSVYFTHRNDDASTTQFPACR